MVAGSVEDTIGSERYNDLKNRLEAPWQYQSISVSSRGTNRTYEGIPLAAVLQNIHSSLTIDRWNQGYELTLTAQDGYSITFSTQDIAADALLLYDTIDGQTTQPGTVGALLSTQYNVKELAAITINLGETLPEQVFVFELSINDSLHEFTLAELAKTPYYTAGRGAYTTSAGTYYENHYEGVRLADLLSSFLPNLEDSTITVVATDGYRMSYDFNVLNDQSKGTWILAFIADGEYMDEDPGPMRIIMVAEDGSGLPIPNIDGHSSPKMVKRVELTGEVFQDFSLRITGKMASELDRSTLQAGINCTAHKTTVEYLNKKSGEVETYTGIPLYALLAYGDDPQNVPHRQTDKTILSYDQQAAQNGYQVRVIAGDGFAVTLDSRELDGNNDVIIAMYQDDIPLQSSDWPLKLVWDADAPRVPDGIKAVRNVVAIELLF